MYNYALHCGTVEQQMFSMLKCNFVTVKFSDLWWFGMVAIYLVQKKD